MSRAQLTWDELKRSFLDLCTAEPEAIGLIHAIPDVRPSVSEPHYWKTYLEMVTFLFDICRREERSVVEAVHRVVARHMLPTQKLRVELDVRNRPEDFTEVCRTLLSFYHTYYASHILSKSLMSNVHDFLKCCWHSAKLAEDIAEKPWLEIYVVEGALVKQGHWEFIQEKKITRCVPSMFRIIADELSCTRQLELEWRFWDRRVIGYAFSMEHGVDCKNDERRRDAWEIFSIEGEQFDHDCLNIVTVCGSASSGNLRDVATALLRMIAHVKAYCNTLRFAFDS